MLAKYSPGVCLRVLTAATRKLTKPWTTFKSRPLGTLTSAPATACFARAQGFVNGTVSTYSQHSTHRVLVHQCSSSAQGGVERAPSGQKQSHPLPLCEREAAFTAQLGDLLSWRQQAVQAVRDVGDSFVRSDAGPSAEDLLTELEWVLDDSVAGVRAVAGGGGGSPWTPREWRRLQAELESASRGCLGASELPADVELPWVEVRLRESLEGLSTLWRRRLQDRVPLQFLTSSGHWRDMVLAVGPGVLIPRPETETLLELALEALKSDAALLDGPWADLGTGSGALAIGLARALPPHAKVWAVDASDTAAGWARHNCQWLGVEDRVGVVVGDWYTPLAGLRGRLAGIISNPPYIPEAQMAGLQAEVGCHEPKSALNGGPGDGLESLVPIVKDAAGMLRSGGWIGLETAGGTQAHCVADLLRAQLLPKVDGSMPSAAFQEVEVRKDLFGVERFVVARRT